MVSAMHQACHDADSLCVVSTLDGTHIWLLLSVHEIVCACNVYEGMQCMSPTSHTSTYAEPTLPAVLQLLFICSLSLLACCEAVLVAHAQSVGVSRM